MLRKKEFDVLLNLNERNINNYMEIATELFVDVDEIKGIISRLNNAGFCNKFLCTEKGRQYLEEHKIDNAIILAAGMSTRFVPLNFEKPKGLLKVNGETLVERQIQQLHDKGIDDITIVVGHMKEMFEYLVDKYGVRLIEVSDYKERNNHASVYAAREFLGNTIITSSDLYFAENIFQKYAYDAYYCTIYKSGKTPERGIITDNDDKIIKTMYGDRCYDIWVTLGYAFFSKRFSKNFIKILDEEFNKEETKNKFWADVQDEHLDELSMYAKRVADNIIYEFDSLEELREFDDSYLYNSNSNIMHQLSYMLGVRENNIVGIETAKNIKATMFKFRCKGDTYICDIDPDNRDRLTFMGRMYYQCRDYIDKGLKLYKMDKKIMMLNKGNVNTSNEIEEVYSLVKDFHDYHQKSLPLCAAENVISEFANIPLMCGFQERYIMNNTYSFNMDDNFIGCEKLFPFYKKISEVCSRIFNAKYVDPRPFTGMHCIDMITKTICKPGDKMMILGKEYGGHASVQPVVERLGVKVLEAPYDINNFDLDYDSVNRIIEREEINYILLAPSDIIKPLDVERINTEKCVLLWDCSQLMGLIAAGLVSNPLKDKNNVIMFGGTHKTFPGPASGLILTNDKYLHEMMETNINPKYLRHSQMHQKISLLFSLLEFEKYGADYMSHMVHCSNYLGEKLRELGYDIPDADNQISYTHQIFIRCSKMEMDTIYDNAYKCHVTLNKKNKKLFNGYGIRLGTQEIARYDWDDAALDKIAVIISMLSSRDIDVKSVQQLVSELPEKKIKFCFGRNEIEKFTKLI